MALRSWGAVGIIFAAMGDIGSQRSLVRQAVVPEIIEIEMYRRAAESTVGREICSIDVTPADYLRGGVGVEEVAAAVCGTRVLQTDRRGKLLLLGLDSGHLLGLRFAMTGRLVVDGAAPIEQLEYGPTLDRDRFVRFTMGFADGGAIQVNDARRLGSVELDPDVDRLGPDAWNVAAGDLERVLMGTVAIKTRLLDQSRLAGLGNLLIDEVLWREAIAPGSPANSAGIDRSALARQIGAVIVELDGLGGSHRGKLQPHRNPDGRCPLDGAALRHESIGGRSTYWCPQHQR